MPNGRTDLFEVETADLLTALHRVHVREGADAAIGKVFHACPPADEAVTIAELCLHVAQGDQTKVMIEEQHWCEYLIHAGDRKGRGWVWITTESPAFPEVRSLHHGYYAKALLSPLDE